MLVSVFLYVWNFHNKELKHKRILKSTEKNNIGRKFPEGNHPIDGFSYKTNGFWVEPEPPAREAPGGTGEGVGTTRSPVGSGAQREEQCDQQLTNLMLLALRLLSVTLLTVLQYSVLLINILGKKFLSGSRIRKSYDSTKRVDFQYH